MPEDTACGQRTDREAGLSPQRPSQAGMKVEALIADVGLLKRTDFRANVAPFHEEVNIREEGRILPSFGECHPYLAFRRILARLADLSRPFGTRVEVNGDTAEIKLSGEK